MVLFLKDFLKGKNLSQKWCSFSRYTVGHRMLSLRVQDIDYFFIFENVVYFEGRTSWRGFILHEGSQEEKSSLLEDHTQALSEPEAIQDYLDQLQLHIIETTTPGLVIKIICYNAYVDKKDFWEE